MLLLGWKRLLILLYLLHLRNLLLEAVSGDMQITIFTYTKCLIAGMKDPQRSPWKSIFHAKKLAALRNEMTMSFS